MAKRKYTRIGETAVAYKCTKCKWIGKDYEKARRRVNEYWQDDVCPNCGNNSFFGLLYV